MQIYLLSIGEILKSSVKKLIHKHMEYLCIHLYILITQKMETFRRGYSFLTLSFILYSYYLQSLQRLSTRVCKYFRPVMSTLMMNWPLANGTIGLLAQKAAVLVKQQEQEPVLHLEMVYVLLQEFAIKPVLVFMKKTHARFKNASLAQTNPICAIIKPILNAWMWPRPTVK